MNQRVYNIFSGIYSEKQENRLLPHQLASLDFLYKEIIENNQNVLLFHKMGSGKTIIGLLFSLFASKEGLKVFIVLPNNNIKVSWESQMAFLKTLIVYDDYKSFNIVFMSNR